MRERLQHLATAESLESDADPEYARWADVRLERWLVDWALRNGKEKTAKQIAKDRGLEVRSFPYTVSILTMAVDITNYSGYCIETSGYRLIL